jgi:hypothetical protein
VACSHHLLLEVAQPERHHNGWASRAPGLMMARRGKPGRRKLLRSSSAAELVRVWIDDALERLWSLPDSCALDVAEREEGGTAGLAEALGCTPEWARQLVRPAVDRLKSEARKHLYSHEAGK